MNIRFNCCKAQINDMRILNENVVKCIEVTVIP
jgi:hypothetical protein